MNSTIEYHTPQAQRPISRWWIRVAWVSALAPMVAGTITIALWLATFSRVFTSLGALTILIGLVLFAVGSVCLLVHVVLSASRKARSWDRSAVIAAVLLVLNFPLALAYFGLGHCWHVTVVNKTGTTVNGFTILVPSGRTVAVPDIPPGGRQGVWFNPAGEGEITFTAHAGGQPLTGTIAGYVTSGMAGERKVVTLNSDGTVHVP